MTRNGARRRSPDGNAGTRWQRAAYGVYAALVLAGAATAQIGPSPEGGSGVGRVDPLTGELSIENFDPLAYRQRNGAAAETSGATAPATRSASVGPDVTSAAETPSGPAGGAWSELLDVAAKRRAEVGAASTQAPAGQSLAVEQRPLGAVSSQAQPVETSTEAEGNSTFKMLGGAEGIAQTLAALGLVIGLIFMLAWGFKKMSGKGGTLAAAMGGAKAPSGLLEVMGRYPIGPRTQLLMLRFDRRVLLVAQSSAGRGGGTTMTTLSELIDPEDVASIIAQVREHDGSSVSSRFADMLRSADDRHGGSNTGLGGRHDANDPWPVGERAAYTPPSPRPARPTNGMPRRTIETPEGDRAELWGDPTRDNNDAVGGLRKRLAAMRGARA